MNPRKRGRVLRLLVRLYPREFRERYGESLASFHRERMASASPVAWLTVVADHVMSAAAERIATAGRDIRYSLRGIARRPLFSFIVIGTVALGVGANAAIFSVVYGVMLRPLPYPEAARLVSITHKPPYGLVSAPEFVDYRRGVRALESLAAFTRGEVNLLIGDAPDRVGIASVSPDFFTTLGVSPQRGRVLAPDDAGAPATVVVVSDRLWRQRLDPGADPIGARILVNGTQRTIVGVMPASFGYPTEHVDLWLPMPPMNPDSLGDRAYRHLSLVGRIRDGASVESMRAEASAFATAMMHDNLSRYDPNQPLVPAVSRVADVLMGPARAYLWVLFAAVALVLMIACINVANLLLARGEDRRREMGVRAALGASRSRLASQLLTESAVLCGAGGLAGLLLATAGHRVLLALAPESLPRVADIRLDWTVVAYTFAVAAAASLLAGLAPAMRAGRDSGNPLGHGERATHGRGARRVRRTLVVVEVALAVMMLNGAGLFVRSLVNAQEVDLGFAPDSAVSARISLPPGYSEGSTAVFYSRVLDGVRGLPGVHAAGLGAWLPVVDAGPTWALLQEGRSYETIERAPTAVPTQVSPGYFRAMGIPLKRGRDFGADDREHGPFVAVVSESLAEELWPGEDAIGKRLRIGVESAYLTVIGIAADIRARGFNEPPDPTMYVPHAQAHRSAYFMPRAMSLVVRTSGDPTQVGAQVRAIVRALDATVPVTNVRTLHQVVGTSVANRRFTTSLISGFAVVALALAGIGIFGLVSYDVSERRVELGVRVAMGADRLEVLGLVLKDGIAMAASGAAFGLVGAALMARSVRAMLVDVGALDLTSVAVVLGGLVLVVVAAATVPARRALRVNPAVVLRGG